MAPIQPLLSYPIWNLSGMVQVPTHGPHPTNVFVSDMVVPASPRQGVTYHAHMVTHNGYGPGTRAQGPEAAGPQAPAQELLGLGPYPL